LVPGPLRKFDDLVTDTVVPRVVVINAVVEITALGVANPIFTGGNDGSGVGYN
jgi:hypothetical protein